MATKRRLSKGSSLIGGIPFAEDDDELKMEDDIALPDFDKEVAAFPSRRQSGGFRRGSILGSMMSGAKSPPLNPVEQARIAEMYKTVIQLSTDNKLTEKNSWNYDLIDHMGRLIKDEAAQGVNFQKASCTLDASVKIYSNRVDDTYATSHRILETLSRNANERDYDEEDDSNPTDELVEGEPRKPKGKVGSKAASNKLGVAKTIEKNVSSLNMVKLEHDYGVDPMFQKMAKAFDEGGAKGMIMYNMRIPREGAFLSFDCSRLVPETNEPVASVEEKTETTPAISDSVDISDLIFKSGFTLSELAQLELCPPLDDYRAQIGFPENSTGILERLVILPPNAATTTSTIVSQEEGVSQYVDNAFDMAGGCDGFDDDNDFFPLENEPATSAEDTSRRDSTGSSSAQSRSSLGNNVPLKSKIQWDFDNGATSTLQSSNTSSPLVKGSVRSESYQQITDGLENLQLLSESNVNPYASDYTVFDVDALVSNNSWAGAKHWKYATRRKETAAVKLASVVEETSPVNNDEEDDEEVESSAVGKKRKPVTKKTSAKSKEAVKVDFTLDLVSEADLDLPSGKSKRDTTLMTAAAMEKMALEAEALSLPSDTKMQLKDLCRLFLTPSIIVPPAQFHTVIQNSINKDKTTNASYASSNILRHMFPEDSTDILWGQPQRVVPKSRFGEPNEEVEVVQEGGAGYYDDDGDNEYLDQGDYNFDSVNDANSNNNNTSVAPDSNTGLAIDTNKLVQASRIVEKIDIGYATVSKRVNIQRLKADIWSNIEQNLPINTEEQSERAVKQSTTTSTKDALSFQDMISDIAANPRQKDVTLPFYFICLLHLANENGLKIEDREDMSDLIITKGMK